ncbi:hypothetical protein EBQ91_06865 [bacterium]|nr:hypothetical protein [bacterium]
MDDEQIWKIIHSYFEDNPQCLVSHHIDSYNDFFQKGIFQIFKEKNPVTITSNYDENLGDFRNQCHLYMGGKDGSKIYFGKPVIYDDNDKQSNSSDLMGAHYMFPNEARLRNMTYGMTIHYDIDVEFVNILAPGEQPAIVVEEIEKRADMSTKKPANMMKRRAIIRFQKNSKTTKPVGRRRIRTRMRRNEVPKSKKAVLLKNRARCVPPKKYAKNAPLNPSK